MIRLQFVQLEPYLRLDRIAHGPKYAGRADDIRNAITDLVRAMPESRLDVLRPWLPLAYHLTLLACWMQAAVLVLP